MHIIDNLHILPMYVKILTVIRQAGKVQVRMSTLCIRS